MKLYMHPASNASRPVLLFLAEKKIECETQVIDLMKGEHYGDPFTAINPNRQVPVLDDGDFRLTESSAILKYLASKINAPEYPNELKKRAKVDEAMDWFNTQFYRDFGYGLCYPQLFPHHKRPSDDIHNGVIAWGKDKTAVWLGVLDQHMLGASKQYVCGDQISLADYLGISFVTIGELIRCDFAAYKNVSRWIGNMKKLSSWAKVNEAHYGFAGMLKDKPFEAIKP